jgi:hypothetical protein
MEARARLVKIEINKKHDRLPRPVARSVGLYGGNENGGGDHAK